MIEAAAERAERLELSLGDPLDPLNPVGFEAIAAADERREPVCGAAPLLAEFGLNAELVPIELGGRLRDVDGLIEILRALARRDPSLALARGGVPLAAAVLVWAGGRDEQRRAAAELLLRGGRLTAGVRWGGAGEQLPRLERGYPSFGRDRASTLTGRCGLLPDGDCADAAVIPALVDRASGGRGREWLLLDLAGAPQSAVEHLPRLSTVGLTGVRFAGLDFHGLRLGTETILDRDPGNDALVGIGAAVLRTALPGVALAALDSALRLTLGHMRTRRLYGEAASDLPAIRSLLARTFLDLLTCDCLLMAAARMISRLPAQAELYSLASLCFAADVVPSAMHRLSVGLGARFYTREGAPGMFQKLLRDLLPLGLDGAGRKDAELALLRGISAGGAVEDDSLPREVFRTPTAARTDERSVPWHQGPRGDEPWHAGTVRVALEHASAERELRGLATLLERSESDRRELKVGQLARVFAAAACAGTWLHQCDGDCFLGAPTWLRGAMASLIAPGGLGDVPIPEDVEAALYAELCNRYEHALSFDLGGTAAHGLRRSVTLREVFENGCVA